MSNSRRFNERVKKRRATVQELEEVESVDRRGVPKVGLRPVQEVPVPKSTSPGKRKRPRWKSPSPVASKSNQPKFRTGKVWAIHLVCTLLMNLYQTQNDFLREWIPKRDSYLNLMLDMEGQPGDGTCDTCTSDGGEFRCSDCMGDHVYCRKCLLQQHKCLPFHRIHQWNGKYFARTTLHKEGHVIYLGHRGDLCPNNIQVDDPWEEDGDIERPDVDVVDEDNQSDPNYEINIVHTTGVFKHRVRWCQCQAAPDRPVQLFQLGLFPASLQRPKTAITFDALDYFYIDAMECKTSAASFIKKVSRLTNNAFPHKVPVSSCYLQGKT
jgi:hypothetical protein